jgi:hypothetical protein
MHRLRGGPQPSALLHYRISCRLREPASEVDIGSPGRHKQAVVPNKHGRSVVFGQAAEFKVSTGLTTGPLHRGASGECHVRASRMKETRNMLSSLASMSDTAA